MSRIVIKRRRCCMALATTMCLSGCASGLLPKAGEPLKEYVLQDRQAPRATGTVSAQFKGPTLVVGEVRAVPGFDTQRIVFVRHRDQIDSFALSRWVDTPARMLGPLIVEAIDRSGTFGAVMGSPSSAIGSWRLDIDLLRLQQDFTSVPSRIRLTLRAVLIETASRRVLASRVFDATVVASSDDTVGGVAAANQAVDEMLRDVTSFCADTVSRLP